MENHNLLLSATKGNICRSLHSWFWNLITFVASRTILYRFWKTKSVSKWPWTITISLKLSLHCSWPYNGVGMVNPNHNSIPSTILRIVAGGQYLAQYFFKTNFIDDSTPPCRSLSALHKSFTLQPLWLLILKSLLYLQTWTFEYGGLNSLDRACF